MNAGVETRLAVASLRFRAAASLATFLAVLLGSGILIACAGLFESAIRLDAPPQRLAGAPVVVAGSAGFALPDEESETVAYAERSGVDSGLTATIAEVPGVERAVPDVSFPAVVAGQTAPTVLSGHGWSSAPLTPYTIRGGTEPKAAGEVVLDTGSAERAGVGPGDRLDIVVGGQSRSFVVTGVAQAGRPVDAAAIFFSPNDVQRFWTKQGTVDLIGVLPRDGVSGGDLAGWLAGRFPGLSVLTGADRGAAEFTGVTASFLPLILLASVFGGMMMVVMGLVVAATIGLSVRQRQRELALLRASGATPRQVHRMVVAETMVVSGLAALGGIGLGALLGRWIFTLSAGRGVVPATLEFHQGIIPFAAGTLVALAVPFAAANLAARAAARTRPIKALTEAAIPPVALSPRRRLLAAIFGAATVLLAMTTAFMDPDTASAIGGPALLTGTVAVGLYGPELIGLVVDRIAGVARRIAGYDGELAVRNTRSRAVQFAAVLTPITLAAAIALGNIYTQTTKDAAAIDGHLEQFSADAVLGSSTGGISPGLLAAVRDTPGVGDASALVSSQGWIEQPYDGRGSDPWSLLGIDAPAAAYTAPVTAGSLRDLTGNSVAVPAEPADELGIGVGSQVRLRLGDGTTADVTVVALLDTSEAYGSVLLPADLLARHTTSGLPAHVLVRAASGVDGSALLGALARTARSWPGTTVGGQGALAEIFQAGLDVEAWINYLLAALAITYAAIASINTLAVLVLSRRREFAVQRLTGATPRQVVRMVLVESGIVATAGLVTGAAIALLSVLSMAIAAGSIVPSGPVWVLLAVILAVCLIAGPVTVLCARRAMRESPIEGLELA